MSKVKIERRAAVVLAVLSCLALALPLAAQALGTGRPHAVTGKVSHVRGTTGELEGAVNAHGLETTYYFEYGPTVAYGYVTPTTSVGSGVTAVKVGQTVSKLLPGDHYRIVATNSAGVGFGLDRLYALGAKGLNKLELPKEPRVVVYGSPFLLSGTLIGADDAGRKVVLQSSPYPFLEPFVTVSAPAVTNASGAFSFRVENLLQTSQLRVVSLDLAPIYSAVVTERVAVRVTFHARASKSGLVRLYGTVTPALKKGARVAFQLAKAVRPGRSEREVAFATQFRTKVVRATQSFSRFSMVVRVRRQGNYRALVEPPAGPLVAGSSAHILLHATPKPARKRG